MTETAGDSVDVLSWSEAVEPEPLTREQVRDCRALVDAGDPRAARYLTRLVLTIEDQARHLEARARDLARFTQVATAQTKELERRALVAEAGWESSRREDGG